MTTFGPPEKAISGLHTVVLFFSAENIVIAHVFISPSEMFRPERDDVCMRRGERETGDGHSVSSSPQLDPVRSDLS